MKNYDYPAKRHWRRWAWNRIQELSVATPDGPVLFLAGDTAEDIEIASSRGFLTRDMIAVERDPHSIRKLRDMGITTIDGDLIKVLRAWPRDRPVKAVVADFCCGLEKRILYDLPLQLTLNPALRRTCIAINLQRGYEHSLRDFRKGVAEYIVEQGGPEAACKHRGMQFFIGMTAIYWSFGGVNQITSEKDAMRWFVSRCKPAFGEYKSIYGNLIFDSVVMLPPYAHLPDERARKCYSDNPAEDRGRGTAERRRIAAALAVRTKRFGVLT